MGTVTIKFCDVCMTEAGVKTQSVTYGTEPCAAGGRSEDVAARCDLCPKCKTDLDWLARNVSDVSAPGKADDRFRTSLAALYEGVASGAFRRSSPPVKKEP